MRLARQPTSCVPVRTLAEAIETTRIHRVAGLTGNRTALVTPRPCRAPHQTLSDAGLIGGGHVPMPGEVSLAHNGVRCLDELPEFRRHGLEVLRQPLENSIRDIPSPGPGVIEPVARATIAARIHMLRGDAANTGGRDIRYGYPTVQEKRSGRLLK